MGFYPFEHDGFDGSKHWDCDHCGMIIYDKKGFLDG
jgi:hypothetical protein